MDNRHSTGDTARVPRVSFVSLGCPKALVDSERIITRLRAEGYELARSHAGADLAVVNTCGFLDSAQAESLAAIGQALNENGKVLVPGCMGAEQEKITARYPGVLAITGPQQYESVVAAVHRALPPRHDPFLDLLPPEGIKLTPRHYAYLKISEGCNNRCSFCIIPKLRGDLVSRPAADMLCEAERRGREGASGHFARHFGLRERRQICGERVEGTRGAGEVSRSRPRARRARRLGAAALCLPLPARGRGDPVDGRGQGPALSRCPVSACGTCRAAPDETAGRAGEDPAAHRPLARDLPGPHHPLDLHRRLSRRE